MVKLNFLGFIFLCFLQNAHISDVPKIYWTESTHYELYYKETKAKINYLVSGLGLEINTSKNGPGPRNKHLGPRASE